MKGQRTIIIRKEGDLWKVIRDDRDKKFPRGQPLTWKLERDPKATGKPVSAHFQFTDDDLFDHQANRDRLTKDLTAEIPPDETTLSLKLDPDACRRRNPRYYAVWIRDEQHPRGGVYAVGETENPPPEIDVGGP